MNVQVGDEESQLWEGGVRLQAADSSIKPRACRLGAERRSLVTNRETFETPFKYNVMSVKVSMLKWPLLVQGG